MKKNWPKLVSNFVQLTSSLFVGMMHLMFAVTLVCLEYNSNITFINYSQYMFYFI